MKNKNIYILVGAVVVILVIFLAVKPKATEAPSIQNTEDGKTPSTSVTTSKPSQTGTKSATKSQNQTSKTDYVAPSKLPNIDFMDQRLSFSVKDFPKVKITIEKVAFGRGETVISSGCTGIPNADFSAYLYPGNEICISDAKVDGAPRGIVAFHLLVENNGDIGFGGNSDTFKLHYLRSGASGGPVYKFAHPLIDLASYYVKWYSSEEIILSYLVPEDQLVFNLVSGYKEPISGNGISNVYDFSTNGILVDFGSRTLKIVK